MAFDMHSSLANFRPASWQGVILMSLTLLAIQLVSVLIRAIYNLFFHPLAGYPGPKLWIAFPVLRSLAFARGVIDLQIREFHARYGSTVRISPDELTYASATAWKDIYGHGHAELPKFFPMGIGRPEPGHAFNIINSDAKDHFRFRRAMLPAFSDRALDQQESIIRSYVDLLVRKLGEVASGHKATDMVRWYSFTTFDLIGDLAYGQSFDGLKEGKQNHWINIIETMMRMFPILILVTSSPWLGKAILFLAGSKIKKAQGEHLRMTTELATARIKNKNMDRRGDFMDFIMRAEGKEHGLSHAEIVSNSDILIIAGSETTATLLSGVTFHLLKTPRAMKLCVDEVRNAFSTSEEITFKAASAKLPYMLAVLDEGLRMFPPLPTATFRETLPGQTTIIDGKPVPGNTRVGCHHLSTYHSPDNFHDAVSFRPERWLKSVETDPTSPFYTDNREAFQPFNVGPRNCIGRNLAYHEMRLILAKVLWHFDLALEPGYENWVGSQKTFSLWEKPPLMVRISPRSD